ncbi:hypothetical protein [Ktedonospora formicarum]|uniref:Uncharacterized protein n=1 Tax=Ktedonospora formicarum TaxID=2778364 RepID=A0A8J3MV91_9CHLR|nr:hypothetical protein [Ktedonospora formicarum]GHO47696.1 hypothetical protein KSX_58590 [Ktedonospora formicarum]
MIRTSHLIVPSRVSPLSRWPHWVGYATALWSLCYCFLALYWMLARSGFPLGVGDPHPEYSIFRGMPVEVGAPAIALLSGMGTAIAFFMAKRQGRGILPVVYLTFASVIAILLLFMIPDDRVLACIVHVLLGHFEMLDWTVANQLFCIIGGVCWSAMAFSYQRYIRRRCLYCGRRDDEMTKQLQPNLMLQWGKWAVALAVITPLIYCVTRWAFVLGIPLGVSATFLRTMERENPGIWLGGAAIATIGLVGALLTLGLVQRWGEIFPRWMIGLAGKRVPPALAIIPASLVALFVLEAGLGMIRHALNGAFAFAAQNPGTYLPGLLWPVWGLALGTATLAYYYRRREKCQTCGRR